jgi:hypothetical protein
MKAKPCKLIVNTRNGYCCAPQVFDSINQAVKYARHEAGGFAWRLFDLDGKLIKSGFCDNTPWNGYRGI